MSDYELPEYSLRSAGRVERYHATPTIQRQTVADHTWQVMRVWFEIFGCPSTEVAIAILLHDVGEQLTGDLPHQVKRDNPELKGYMNKLEAEHVNKLLRGISTNENHWPPKLTAWDWARIKICDLIEMAEFAFDELTLGNKQARTILYNVRAALWDLFDRWEEEEYAIADIKLAKKYFHQIDRRFDELI